MEDNNINFSEGKRIRSDLNVLKPLTGNNYKTEDTIKIHEFRRENIVDPFVDTNKDFFAYTNENDSKYDFMHLKNMFRSKLMIKAIYWSLGIGSAFFIHRYIRRRKILVALRWGFSMTTISFLIIWGNFELQPFITSWYYSKFIEKLSSRDVQKNVYKYYLIKATKEAESIYDQYGVSAYFDYSQSYSLFQFLVKYENEVLSGLGYKENNINALIKKREDDDMNPIYNEDEPLSSEYYIDFDLYKKQENNCYVNKQIIMDKEQILNKSEEELTKLESIKKAILLNDKLSRDINTKTLLQNELKIAKEYLIGNFKEFEDDADYKTC